MRVAQRGWAAVAFAILLVLTSVGPAAGTADATGRTTPAETSALARPQSQPTVAGGQFLQVADDDSINQTQTYALTPEQPGEVAVTLTYEIPDRVVSLETAVPRNATVTDTDGFSRVNETTFVWDEDSRTATIDYLIDPNETAQKAGIEGSEGRYVAVDAGEWALISRSQTPTRWRYTGRDQMTFEQAVTTDGPGAAGDQLVYLGEVETFQREADGQTFRLVVPERAELAESPEEILDSLAAASDSLRVGDRDEEVFVVAAPTDGVDWGVRGLEQGGSDMWVQDDEPLDTAENVWLHEYTHTRQSFTPTKRTRWLTEGTAVYYAAFLSLEQDRIDFDAFRDVLEDGERSVYDSVVLAEPATWEENTNYVKGSLAAGRIDEEIRVQTASEATFQGTIRELNGMNQPVTQEELLTAVERTGGNDSRATAATYTETPADLQMWNASVHARVFGQLPARISYSLPDASESRAYRVSGPYRSTNVTETSPIRLATGETLTVEALVSNAGGTEGTYNATLDINGTAVTTERGRIEPGEEQMVPLSHTFATPGLYTASIDGTNVTVVVERPARTRVTDVQVSSETLTQGDSVVVTATVRNDADVPATGTVVFTRDYQAVATREVSLPPENTTRVASGIPLPEAGSVVVSAGGANPVRITVTPSNGSATTQTPTGGTSTSTTGTVTPNRSAGTTAADGPGFTVVGTLLAALLAAFAAACRRS
ncbi:peptidase [Haloarcula amylovorans]|uniref:peptidase n=1 Tax=Haloarcula amylovorans TaxID=2562280 RepID=UPI0010767D35|nr:peptidase [Halomicroarcula amylolytica]